MKWIKDRRAARAYHPESRSHNNRVAAPWTIRILGESGVHDLSVSKNAYPNDYEVEQQVTQLRTLFPEADVRVFVAEN